MVIEDLLSGADDRILDVNGNAIAWSTTLGGAKGFRAERIDK